MKTKKIKKIWKDQKPTDIDTHLKYRCPNQDCEYDHWISLRESKTQKFKIVCDCGTVFMPRQVSKLKISYAQVQSKKIEDPSKTTKEQPTTANVETPLDTLRSCGRILVAYGFTDQEANKLINSAYHTCENKDPSSLIKFILKNLENYDER